MAKKEHSKPLHKRNHHHGRYDFKALIQSEKSLQPFVQPNKYGDLSIDFFDPDAVMALNGALLKHFYNIKNWSIPKEYLCPPIPGRADYIHYLADLLSISNQNNIPKGKGINALDVGVGANGIYPLIGNAVYQWSFVGSDIDKNSIENVQKIIQDNALDDISVIHQKNSADIFHGIINKEQRFDCTLCNPPFHKSKKEAQAGTNRKLRNLTKTQTKSTKLNFGGQSNELWCKGGEVAFIKKMIVQSKAYEKQVFWFTTLVSKQQSLKEIYKALNGVKPVEVKTIQMQQGQKTSRFVAWTFLTPHEQKQWVKNFWNGF